KRISVQQKQIGGPIELADLELLLAVLRAPVAEELCVDVAGSAGGDRNIVDAPGERANGGYGEPLQQRSRGGGKSTMLNFKHDSLLTTLSIMSALHHNSFAPTGSGNTTPCIPQNSGA